MGIIEPAIPKGKNALGEVVAVQKKVVSQGRGEDLYLDGNGKYTNEYKNKRTHCYNRFAGHSVKHKNLITTYKLIVGHYQIDEFLTYKAACDAGTRVCLGLTSRA